MKWFAGCIQEARVDVIPGVLMNPFQGKSFLDGAECFVSPHRVPCRIQSLESSTIYFDENSLPGTRGSPSQKRLFIVERSFEESPSLANAAEFRGRYLRWWWWRVMPANDWGLSCSRKEIKSSPSSRVTTGASSSGDLGRAPGDFDWEVEPCHKA